MTSFHRKSAILEGCHGKNGPGKYGPACTILLGLMGTFRLDLLFIVVVFIYIFVSIIKYNIY